VGKVCSPAKTRPHGKGSAYNRETGSRREGSRLAAEAVRAMTARTTTSLEQRASGRAWPSLAGKTGRSAACGYHAPGRSAGMAARLMVRSSGSGEGGKPTRQLPATCGLVEEPVAVHAVGNAAADMRSLPAGLGKTQRPVDRGVGGNRRQAALPCGARRLPPTRPSVTSALCRDQLQLLL
jgi:hypothetical protein